MNHTKSKNLTTKVHLRVEIFFYQVLPFFDIIVCYETDIDTMHDNQH